MEVFHSQLEKKFFEYLVNLGYPKDSIIYDPSLLSVDGRHQYNPSFLIVDPIKQERLAIIEINDRELLDASCTYHNKESFRKAIRNENIQLFIVTESESPMDLFPFDLYLFSLGGKFIKSDFSLFPTFLALTAEESASRKTDLRNAKSETVETFQKISWSLAFILLAVVITDFICAQFNIELLTTERMALLGGAVALIVIPFAQKFKGLGIEWEKSTKVDKSS